MLEEKLFSSPQKLLQDAKETDKVDNKKKEEALLASEVRKLNYFAALRNPHLFIF